jgi:hypothetical protein
MDSLYPNSMKLSEKKFTDWSTQKRNLLASIMVHVLEISSNYVR